MGRAIGPQPPTRRLRALLSNRSPIALHQRSVITACPSSRQPQPVPARHSQRLSGSRSNLTICEAKERRPRARKSRRPSGQPFGAHPRRHHRNAGGERLQQFHAHARAAEDRAHEHGVSAERLAHVFDEADQLDRLRLGQENAAAAGRSRSRSARARGSFARTFGSTSTRRTSPAPPGSAGGGSCRGTACVNGSRRRVRKS